MDISREYGNEQYWGTHFYTYYSANTRKFEGFGLSVFFTLTILK